MSPIRHKNIVAFLRHRPCPWQSKTKSDRVPARGYLGDIVRVEDARLAIS